MEKHILWRQNYTVNKERNTKQNNIEASRGKRHPDWKAWDGETNMHMGTEEKNTSREKHEEQTETQKPTYNKTHPQTLWGDRVRTAKIAMCKDVQMREDWLLDRQTDTGIHREET